MKQLQDILANTPIKAIFGPKEVAIGKIEFDSRKVSTRDMFVAIKGVVADGHKFIDACISSGAVAVVCEDLPEELNPAVTYIQVENSHQALAYLAANYYDHPSKALTLCGVTGTNGKTTIATLMYQMFTKAGHPCGLLSTVKILVGKDEYPATHTTPDSITINRYMRMMVDQGITHCFMEVSSHGIHQFRTAALDFDGGIFTNLTHDHLDYHPTFAAYRDVKKSFFDHLPKTAFALTNIDDKNGPVMLQNTTARKRTYSLKSLSDYKAQVLENGFMGLVLKIDNQEVHTRLIGDFNAYNLLAIYGASRELGMEQDQALCLLSQLESVSGRFQYVVSDSKITAIVDYAHTPDALENVLKTISQIRSGNEQLITVVGCGGDRDTTKRPEMAKIAAQYSTKTIFTSDNPRSEDPQTIIEQMEAGVPAEHYNRTLSVVDRKQAIKAACQMANTGDIILIAGKGHETYQEIKGVKHDFDDMKIVTEIFQQLNK